MSTSAPTFPAAAGIKSAVLVIQTDYNNLKTEWVPNASKVNNSKHLRNIRNFFQKLVNSTWRTNINVITGGVYANGTATLSGVVATDTLVIGGVTITAVSGTPTSVQFKVGATDAATAANVVATINALTTLNQVVQASSAAAVVTITCIIPGTIGNLVTLSQSGGHFTVGSALTGGTDGSIGDISQGL